MANGVFSHRHFQPARRVCYLPQLLLCALISIPGALRGADFAYEITDNTVTITKYTGSGGAVEIPSTIEGMPVTVIGTNAFFNNDTVTSVVIPDTVVRIGSSAFASLGAIERVAIPNSVTHIGRAAFQACPELQSVVVPDSVQTLERGTFQSCSKLAKVVLGNGITHLDLRTFENCRSLESIKIGNEVTTIDREVFMNCQSLKTIVIPGKVASLGSMVFCDCRFLETLIFQGNAPAHSPYFDAFLGCNVSTVYYMPGTTGWSSKYCTRPAFPWHLQMERSNAGFAEANQGFQFTVTGPTNLAVVIEVCSDLGNPMWERLATNVLSAGTFQFTDPEPVSLSGRFYRTRWP